MTNISSQESLNDLQKYKSAVELMANTKENYVFENSTGHHAAIVLSTLIASTEKKITFYDRDLTGDIARFSKDFLPNLSKILGEGKEVDFIVSDTSRISEDMQNILNENRDNNIKIYHANDKFVDLVSREFGENRYFALADKKMFRLEVDSPDKQTRRAIFSFNDDYYAKKIHSVLNYASKNAILS